MYSYYDPCVLCHHGVKGMKWGVRRYDVKTSNRFYNRASRNVSKERRYLYKQINRKAKKLGDNNSKEGRRYIRDAKREVNDALKQKYGMVTYRNDRNRRILTAAGIAAATIAVGALTYYGIKSGKISKLASAGKTAFNRTVGRTKFTADKIRYKKGMVNGTPLGKGSWVGFEKGADGMYYKQNMADILKKRGTKNVVRDYYTKGGSMYKNYRLFR